MEKTSLSRNRKENQAFVVMTTRINARHCLIGEIDLCRMYAELYTAAMPVPSHASIISLMLMKKKKRLRSNENGSQ